MQTKGYSIRNISSTVNRSPSTVSREIRRNTSIDNTYSHSLATENYKHKRPKCRRRKLLEDENIKNKVQQLFLEQQWSPEQISNRLRYENNPISISYSTIYRGICSGLLEVKKPSQVNVALRENYDTEEKLDIEKATSKHGVR